MSDLLSVKLLITIGDDEATIARAHRGFVDLARNRKPVRHAVEARSSGALLFASEQVLTPREAFNASTETVATGVAAGRISAESITPYPPGIPVVAPGERITREVLDYLREGVGEGMYISGLSDPTFGTIRVVR
jgi:arginine/lysine/ornithine decarboxylase